MQTSIIKPFSVISLLFILLTSCITPQQIPSVEDMHRVLAPTGKLRMGLYEGSPTSYKKDEKTGEIRGLGYAVGVELARNLGVEFEPVIFSKTSELTAASAAGRVDLIMTNASPARRKEIDFSDTLIRFESGYLVAANSKIKTIADVDTTGMKIGVIKASSSEGLLSKKFISATVEKVEDNKAATDGLTSGKLDAFATAKSTLFELSDTLAGSQVLDGAYNIEEMALGIPKYRLVAMPYINDFIKKMKSSDTVKKGIEKARLRGIVKEDVPK